MYTSVIMPINTILTMVLLRVHTGWTCSFSVRLVKLWLASLAFWNSPYQSFTKCPLTSVETCLLQTRNKKKERFISLPEKTQKDGESCAPRLSIKKNESAENQAGIKQAIYRVKKAGASRH